MGDHYERLASFELMRRLTWLRSAPDLAIHRRVFVPESWKAANPLEPPSSYLYDVVADAAQLGPGMTFLDVGCGFGSEIVRLSSTRSAFGIGITTSPAHARRARQMIKEKGIEDSCHVEVASFEDLFPGTFDVITAVESLIHAHNIDSTAQNLARTLRVGGRLVVVEDVWYGRPASVPEYLQSGWSIHKPLTLAGLREALTSADLELIAVEDLTQRVITLSPKGQERWTSFLASLCRFHPLSRHPLVRFYRGQLFMQGAVLAGELGYVMMVAAK